MRFSTRLPRSPNDRCTRPAHVLRGLRTLLRGGAPVPARAARACPERGPAFVQGYGMTETSPGALVPDRVGSAGVPHFFTDVRVRNAAVEDTAPGEKGEVGRAVVVLSPARLTTTALTCDGHLGCMTVRHTPSQSPRSTSWPSPI
ncbi:AMP-binding protein [Streptomyces sp. NBC_01363]|uniref:AMP-binding protein n=1 Tax=Streptomyces sp. NBC_01363 TaxID=2903840 RepID=UPI002B1DE985|nr:AMP-binding protein [Streptomyces sp. NBC_01363]